MKLPTPVLWPDSAVTFLLIGGKDNFRWDVGSLGSVACVFWLGTPFWLVLEGIHQENHMCFFGDTPRFWHDVAILKTVPKLLNPSSAEPTRKLVPRHLGFSFVSGVFIFLQLAFGQLPLARMPTHEDLLVENVSPLAQRVHSSTATSETSCTL